jgi:hypothetical protein
MLQRFHAGAVPEEIGLSGKQLRGKFLKFLIRQALLNDPSAICIKIVFLAAIRRAPQRLRQNIKPFGGIKAADLLEQRPVDVFKQLAGNWRWQVRRAQVASFS